ncbi:MAG: SDR family NAD(P)-dependent oxidoreductase [Clostridia bacterium]
MKNAVITGATSGIGLAVCEALLLSGHRVIGIGRSAESCEKARNSLLEKNANADIVFFSADLMQMEEVRILSAKIMEYIDMNWNGKLDVLINNAGCVRSRYCTTKEGYEHQFALNHLGSFLLTYYLIDAIIAAKGRVIVTSSESHKKMKMNWDDLMFTRFYRPLRVYKQSKLANMLFAFGLNDRYSVYGIRAYCVDPGLVNTEIGLKQTFGIVSLVWSLRRKKGVQPDIPAKTYLFLTESVTHPEGLYIHNQKQKDHSSYVNRENAERLWKMSEKLCSIEFGRFQ